MNNVEKKIDYLQQLGKYPKATIEATGKEAIGCFPIYAPEEIIYSAGYIPVGMWGGPRADNTSDKYLQPFCCSVMRANMEQGMKGIYNFLHAVILTAYCDTLKCMIENWKVAVPQIKAIPVVYPQNRKGKAAFQFMKEELEDLKKELEFMSGRKITEDDLENAINTYEEYRSAMRNFTEVIADIPKTVPAAVRHNIIKAGWFSDKKEYTKKIVELTNILKELPKERSTGKRVILTGLMCEPVGILDIMNENGIYVVGDDLAHESRQFRASCGKAGTCIERIALRTLKQDGCTFLYDDKKSRGKFLKKMVEKYEADGIVFCQMKFCDPDEFDYPILKKEMDKWGIHMFRLEVEQHMNDLGQVSTRLQAFNEMMG